MLNIPDLSGGINLRDGISEIRDNQLLDAKNVWFDGGFLKTRPAMQQISTLPPEQHPTNFHFTDIYETTLNGELRRMAYIHDGTILKFYWIGKSGCEKALNDFVNNSFIYNALVFKGMAKTIESGSKLYYYLLVNGPTSGLYRYNESETGGMNWLSLNMGIDNDGYIPVAYNHCVTDGEIIGASRGDGNYYPDYRWSEFKGTQFEGYNLLNPYYKIIYSTVNPEIIPVSEMKTEQQYMKYLLPPDCPFVKDPKASACKYVRITVKGKDGKKTVHNATVASDGTVTESDFNIVDNLKFTIKDGWLTFKKKDSALDFATVVVDDYIEDNMEIILPGSATDEDLAKVYNMTRSVWYGGEAAGLNGGTRLFLCGNTEEDNKNLVIWSDLNNPAYFPKYNYMTVGDTSQKVMGFGKQESKLFIFKERETYYTQYASDSGISAENLINKYVVDVVSSTVYFPLVQLNPTIGCDLPDTIQLCDNRLVWANKNGRVYTATSSNQYSESNIYEISAMLGDKLTKNGLSSDAYAVDWDGRYLLISGHDCYVMEYSSYGFRAISSYSKSEDANARIAWWIWEFPKPIMGMISDRNNLTTVSYITPNLIEVGKLDKNKRVDSMYDEIVGVITEEIVSKCTTKFFDFGAPTVKKTVPKISLVFCANGGEPITVTENTDNGSCESVIVMNEDSISTRDPESLVATLIRPAIKNIRRIALTFETKGYLAIESMTLQYKKIGGLK
jgi:hypothetical protein